MSSGFNKLTIIYQSTPQMLYFLTLSGHSSYLKSLVLSGTLGVEHNGLLMQGFLVLRRSDSYWSGVFIFTSSIMWSIKLGVGIARGCGFDNLNSTNNGKGT